MDEMSSPESPTRLNQALINNTLSEFNHFEFIEQPRSLVVPHIVTIDDNSHDNATYQVAIKGIESSGVICLVRSS